MSHLRNQLSVTLLWLLLVVANSGQSNSLAYRNYSLVQVQLSSEHERQYMEAFCANLNSQTEEDQLDYWPLGKGSMAFLVPPKARAPLMRLLSMAHIESHVQTSDMGLLVEQDRRQQKALPGRKSGLVGVAKTASFFDRYQRVAEIDQFLRSLVASQPDIAQLIWIGNSTQGRPLNVLRLGRPGATQSVWLDGGTHAREWITVSTALSIAQRLADNHRKCTQEPQTRDAVSGRQSQRDERIRRSVRRQRRLVSTEEEKCQPDCEQLLARYSFYIMPVLNPDGYEYSHTSQRLWRKTRSPNWGSRCLGTDPNRNYDFKHGQKDSSSSTCSQVYAGWGPFTEPETRQQSSFVLANRAGMRLYVSLHSFGQMIMHSAVSGSAYRRVQAVGLAGARAIRQTRGRHYRVGLADSLLYPASGTGSDWAASKAGVEYAYTIELGDTGARGFLLPQQEIVPTGEEIFNGLLAMIARIESEHGGSSARKQ